MRCTEDDERVRDEVESTVDELIDAGFAESFLGEDGDVRFRLTPAGREYARDIKRRTEGDA
jgi:hypothetical protein